jgi:hypothetical protein
MEKPSKEEIAMLKEVCARLYDERKTAKRYVLEAQRDYKEKDYEWRKKCFQLARWTNKT